MVARRLFVITITVVASGLCGCTGAGAQRTALTGPIDRSTSPSPEALAMAEQARRDVEQIRRLQDGGPSQEQSGAAAAARPPKIEWTTLPGPVAPGAADGDPTAGNTQVSLPHDTPPMRPNPLSLPQVQDTPGGGTASDPATTPAASSSPSPAEQERRRQLIVELCGMLYREGAYSDVPLRELLMIAATTMITPDRSLVPDALPGLTERERELLGRLQEFFTRLGRELADTGDPETVVAAIDDLHRSLAAPVRLGLPQVALCTRVGGFGDYDEFPRNQARRYAFLAHTGQQAVVYVEVEDFVSELNEQGKWVTELSQQLVVFSDRDGIPVWREEWQAGVDVSNNRRDDFFVVQIITFPKALSVGRYQLKIHVRDEKSGAESETSVEIEMVADPRMIGGGSH